MSILKKHYRLGLILWMGIITVGIYGLTQSVATIFFFTLGNLVTLLLIRKQPYWVWLMMGIILLVSVTMVFVVYYANMATFNTPYYIGGGSDDMYYEIRAFRAIARNIYDPAKIAGTVINIYDVGALFYVYLAIVIRISQVFDGYITWIARFNNVFFLMWTVLILIRIFRSIEKNKDKVIFSSLLLFACYPVVQFTTAYVFRDMFNLLLVVMMTSLLIDLSNLNQRLERPTYWTVLFKVELMLVCIYALFFIRRNTMIYPIVIVSAIAWLNHQATILKWFKKRWEIDKRKLVIQGAIVLTVFLALAIIYSFSRFNDLLYYIQIYTEYRQDMSLSGLSRFVYQLPLLPFGLIVRWLYLLISPLPNLSLVLTGLQQFGVATLEVILASGIALVFLGIPYILKSLTSWHWITISFVLISLSIASTTGSFRHMIFYMPFMFYGLVNEWVDTSKKLRKQYFVIGLGVGLLLLVLYGLIKSVL